MNTYEKPKKPTLDVVRLHYVRTGFNKKEITKATLAYYRRSRLVRLSAGVGKLFSTKFSKIFRMAAGRNGRGEVK